MIASHGRRDLLGPRTEILFVYHATLIHEKGHHAGRAVLCRVSHERKSASGLPAVRKTLRVASRGRSLRLQHPEEVAFKRLRSDTGALRIAFRRGCGDERADGTFQFTGCSLPVEPVVLVWIAEKFLGVAVSSVAIVGRREVFLLRIREFQAYLNDRQFVLADSSIENGLLAGGGIEIPNGTFVHQRNGHRPIFRAEVQGSRTVRFHHQAMHLLVFFRYLRSTVLVRDIITGGGDIFAVRSQYFQQGFGAVTLQGRDERAARLATRIKGLLAGLGPSRRTGWQFFPGGWSRRRGRLRSRCVRENSETEHQRNQTNENAPDINMVLLRTASLEHHRLLLHSDLFLRCWALRDATYALVPATAAASCSSAAARATATKATTAEAGASARLFTACICSMREASKAAARTPVTSA